MATPLELLQSIDATLKQLLARFPKPPAEVAPDSDLDGQYGDPFIRTADPRDWHGDSQMGKKFSQCPPDYLDLVASRLDYFAEVAERENRVTSSGKPVAPYNRKDAARARGWAKRLRAGWHAADSEVGELFVGDGSGAEQFPSDALTDEDIAF